MAQKVLIFDSTLRDGAQAEGISFSVEDKLRVLKSLDQAGIDIIEAGNPGSNPKDIEFFDRLQSVPLTHARLCAFGSTRRPGIIPENDANLERIIQARTPVAAIFGKSSKFHVEKILRTTPEENLAMIEDSVAYLTNQGIEVIFDAEHFFDGYKEDPEYALSSLEAAKRGGASCLALCDTNGGSMPDEVYDATKAAIERCGIPVGIHAHNDSGLGTANSLAAVQAGARQVQGTFLGYGERCGNANLSAIVPNLQLRMGYDCVPEESLSRLTESAIRIAEISNFVLSGREPFVGKSAFAHKGGMHIDAVMKNPRSFEHMDPELVGNSRRILMSEVSGRGTIIRMINEIDPTLTKKSAETSKVMDKIKELEYEGYQFEGAESSVRLLIRKELGYYKPFFRVEDFKVIGEKPKGDETLSASAIVKVSVNGESIVSAAEGDGPVNALDKAMRRALTAFYPQIAEVRLTDFKVRVIDKGATASKVRVLMESTDGNELWSNVGVSCDVVEASLIALIDSIEYKLLLDMERQLREYRIFRG